MRRLMGHCGHFGISLAVLKLKDLLFWSVPGAQSPGASKASPIWAFLSAYRGPAHTGLSTSAVPTFGRFLRLYFGLLGKFGLGCRAAEKNLPKRV
jgi:hypothetical protein